uniref:G_PROTEIN_RECEP_F1_2 domain-containing protein n=1 Tax=Trichobilharzia regenti TaxID=157069 RepID=A0AA85K8E4_TRIRE|nr:unnamed protein product [Trichobilharzia regenti]
MSNSTFIDFGQPMTGILAIYSISVIIFGSLGNILILLTISHKNYLLQHENGRSVDSSFTSSIDIIKGIICIKSCKRSELLLILLTYADFICLWIIVLRYAIHLSADQDIRAITLTGCLLHTYLSMVGSNLSVGLLGIFSVQRAIAIIWPMISKKLLTRKCLYICMLITLLIILTKHLPVFILLNIRQLTPDLYVCDINYNDDDNKTKFKYYYYIEFSTHIVLGYVILIISNISLFICLNIQKRNKISNVSIGNDSTTQKSNRIRYMNSARLVLALSFYQVISSIPFFVLVELPSVSGRQIIPSNKRWLAYYITTLLLFTNNSYNFFITVYVSQHFRKSTKLMLLHAWNSLKCKK